MTLDDNTLREFLRELAPLQSLGADLQSVSIAPDRGGRGTPDSDGKRVAQIERGDVERGRVAYARLSQCAARESLSWLVEVAHGAWTLDALALYLARARGPVEAREELEATITAAATLTAARTAACEMERGCVRSGGRMGAAAIVATQERVKADARLATNEARVAAATDALIAWGRDVVLRAWREWEAT
jgi:hypothetical protein